jgi:hypothetical protein
LLRRGIYPPELILSKFEGLLAMTANGSGKVSSELIEELRGELEDEHCYKEITFATG